jgi:hypothetical protein
MMKRSTSQTPTEKGIRRLKGPLGGIEGWKVASELFS